MVIRLSILISFLFLAIALPAISQAQLTLREVEARNQITSGDFSTNVIAENGMVLVFLDENMQEVHFSRESVVRFVRDNQSQRFEDVRERFPFRGQSFIEQVAVAEYAFSRGQYSLSAALYIEVLDEMELQDEGYNMVEGMVTASFYGSARHYEGLRFICNQYRFRPAWNFRFRHAVHAHVRALVAHLGHEAAEQKLDAVRRDPDCRRADFTNAWIPIHLYDMRNIEAGKPYWSRTASWRYGITDPKDLEYAERLLSESGHGFIDYLMFVLGRFEDILRDYPQSYIYDLALLGVGWKAEPKRAIEALEEYIERFETQRTTAKALLIERARELGGDALAEVYAARYPVDEAYAPDNFAMPVNVSDTVRVWVHNRNVKTIPAVQRRVIAEYYAACARYSLDFENAHFDNLDRELARYKRVYEDNFEIDLELEGYIGGSVAENLDGRCLVDFSPKSIDAALAVIAPLAAAQRSFDDRTLATVGRRLKLCGDARDGLRDASADCERMRDALAGSDSFVSFHRASANLLLEAFEMSGRQDASSLFLAGLAFRRIGEYGPFVDAMNLYANSFPDDSFADDALAEIGWFYLTIRGDLRTAERYFGRVVEEYAGTNAYDNALNWLVVSKRMAGDYWSALDLSVQLLGSVISDRLRPKAVERHEEIRFAANLVGTEPLVRIGENPAVSDGFALMSRATVHITVSPFDRLPEGTTINAVEGIRVADADGFFRVLAEVRREGRRYVDISSSQGEFRVDISVFLEN